MKKLLVSLCLLFVFVAYANEKPGKRHLHRRGVWPPVICYEVHH